MPDYDISGGTNANGNWTRHSVERTTQHRGEISFDPTELAGSPFRIRLRSTRSGEVFSNEVTWTSNDAGRKVVATNVLAGTKFTIDSRGSQGKTHFSGKLFTA